jgi:hypothetical protein
MGAPEDSLHERGYDKQFALIEQLLALIFGSAETLMSFDAYQFADYSKVFAPRFDVEKKLKIKTEVFPKDCQKAFDMGVRLAKNSGIKH